MRFRLKGRGGTWLTVEDAEKATAAIPATDGTIKLDLTIELDLTRFLDWAAGQGHIDEFIELVEYGTIDGVPVDETSEFYQPPTEVK